MHSPAHQYGALCHPTVLRLSEQVYFPPLVHMGNLSVFMKVVCEHVCVWECEFLICRRSDLPALYLHMHTI